jgi:hypothetical protein
MGYGTYQAAAGGGSTLDPKLMAMVPMVGRLSQAEVEPNYVPLTIDSEGKIIGETFPQVVPETRPEKITLVLLNLYRRVDVTPEPRLPLTLPINEKGQIQDQTGLDFWPETFAEQQVFMATRRLEEKDSYG